jgi:hypothetical protein
MERLAITLTLFAFMSVSVSESVAEDVPENKSSNRKELARKAGTEKETSRLSDKQISDLIDHAANLAEAIEKGDLSREKAIAEFRGHLQKRAKAGQTAGKQSIDLETLGAKLKKAVADGKMTEKEAVAEYKRVAGMVGKKMTQKRKGQYGSFYSIVIGRLKSKDLELGEFTIEVDYVTSIYGDRKLKDTIIGKTVQVVGVSGPWIDKVLLIKRGETLKLRSGTLNGTTISLSPKATVLERAAPFDPETYPIPPESFRGFQGVVIGTVESKSDQGYDLTMRVEQVVDTFQESKSAEPASIEGRLMDMQGFYNGKFRSSFDDLRIGDRIRVGAAHRVPEIDALEVTQVFEKLEK